jgi:hypothetical protein
MPSTHLNILLASLQTAPVLVGFRAQAFSRKGADSCNRAYMSIAPSDYGPKRCTDPVQAMCRQISTSLILTDLMLLEATSY